MVAPIDAKASFEVGGETITLRLNFRVIALAEKHGIDLLNEGIASLSKTQSVVLLKCLATEDHPDWTEDHALAVVIQAPDALGTALVELFTEYGGKASGNAKGRKPKAQAA